MNGQRWHSRWGAQPEQGQGRRVGVGQRLVCKERRTPTEQQKVSLKWRLGQITKVNGGQASFRVELEPQNVSKWERLVPRAMLQPVCGGWTAGGGLTVWFLGFLHSTVSLHMEPPPPRVSVHLPHSTQHRADHRAGPQQIVTELHSYFVMVGKGNILNYTSRNY